MILACGWRGAFLLPGPSILPLPNRALTIHSAPWILPASLSEPPSSQSF